MPATSVLAFIVPRLVIQAENAVSDCLYFILSTYPKAADSLIGYLRSLDIQIPTPLQFTTQVMWQHAGGRPDMVGMNEDRAFLVVEAKFHAPLTSSQPVDYVQYLPKDAGGVLLFLAPAAKTEELWAQLSKRCFSARIPLGARADDANGLLSASLWGMHRLAIAPWESIISALAQDLSAQPEAHADLSQFRALCERLLSGELTDSGLSDPARDNRTRQLRAMADAVATRLVDEGHATTKGYRATPGPGYYKRYMTLSGHVNWCVEFNSEYWARFGESLIWLSNNLKWVSAADCAVLDATLKMRRLRKEILIPLLARHAHSEAEALDHMTVQAAAIAKLLASTPPLTQ